MQPMASTPSELPRSGRQPLSAQILRLTAGLLFLSALIASIVQVILGVLFDYVPLPYIVVYIVLGLYVLRGSKSALLWTVVFVLSWIVAGVAIILVGQVALGISSLVVDAAILYIIMKDYNIQGDFAGDSTKDTRDGQNA